MRGCSDTDIPSSSIRFDFVASLSFRRRWSFWKEVETFGHRALLPC